VLTLWHQLDLRSLPEKIQTQTISEDWDAATRAKVAAIMPTYEGSALEHGRQL